MLIRVGPDAFSVTCGATQKIQDIAKRSAVNGSMTEIFALLGPDDMRLSGKGSWSAALTGSWPVLSALLYTHASSIP